VREYDPHDWYWSIEEDNSIYSSKRGMSVSTDDSEFVAFKDGGNVATVCQTLDDLIEVQRRNNCPPYHRVAKSTIIYRLTDQQLAAALDAFNQPDNMRLRERWYAPDQPAINADDPESVAFVQAISADSAVVPAPE